MFLRFKAYTDWFIYLFFHPLDLLVQIFGAFCVQGRFRLTAEIVRFQLKLQQ